MHIVDSPAQTEAFEVLQPLKCPFSSWLKDSLSQFSKIAK